MSSSSPYPILGNRPIDKWKVTELKEELKRRRLITRGLKDDLVRRLYDDILAQQQQDSQILNTPAPESNLRPDFTPFSGGSATSNLNQSTPIAPVAAALSTETTPEPPVVHTATSVETTPAPPALKTATSAETTTPPPVFSTPEVKAVTIASHQDKKVADVGGIAGLDGSVVDVKPQEVDVKDGVESEVTPNDQNIHKSENNEPFSGLGDVDSNTQQTEAVLEKAATDNQVSKVIPLTVVEVKSDCFSSVSNNQKIELKDYEIADNVKLEQNVSKSQEPSTFVGESHPMDVQEPLEHKISVGGGNSDATNADMTKENNFIDAGDSEKLNLDRSSGDESMEDEPETKHTESVTSDEVTNKSEKFEMLTDKEKTNTDFMDAGKGETSENKRKLPVNDQEGGGNNEPAKRQRRWNSETIKVPEAQATNSAIPATTPRSIGLKSNFSGSNSSVSEEGPKERVVPPSPKEPTNSLRIDRFLRPFTLKAVQELMGKTGNVTSFWMDHIKTHCYVSYSSVEEAAATREAVYNLQWPPNGGRLLIAEFVEPEEVKAKLEAPLPPPPPQPQPQAPKTALPPPPPLAKLPHIVERLPLPPPPPIVPEEQEPPIVTLDDLFKKTKATPRIYYLPLSEEQVAAKLAGNNK